MRRIIGNEKRAFKGVFIPAEFWLDENLKPMELLLITEIDSLQSKKGCYASNKHFADFLDVSESWVSRIIKNLADQGYLELQYNKKGKQYLGRVIKVVRKGNTPISNQKEGYVGSGETPISDPKGGYFGSLKESNTSLVNQDSNTDRVLGTGNEYPDAREKNSDESQPDNLRSFDLWEQNWGWPNAIATQDLTDWVHEFGDDLVAWTIEFALRRNVSSQGANSWLRKAFDRYRQEGVSTVEEAERKAEVHRQQVDREVKQSKSRNYGHHGRAKRVEELPDWAKDQHPHQSQEDNNDHHEEDSSSAANAKTTPEQLAETQRLLARLREKHKKHQEEQADQEEQRVQQKRDAGRDKNGLADLLHSNG